MTFEKRIKRVENYKKLCKFFILKLYLMKIRITKNSHDVRVRISFKKNALATATDLSITTCPL
jgi:hypothetical protein